MSEYKETEFGRIPFDWDFVRAIGFCEKITDGTHDSPKQQSYGRHLITSKHIKGRDIDFDSAYLISQSDYEKINQRSKVDQWDVIISMIGEYCGFSYIERNKVVDYAVKNVGIFKTGNKDNAFWLHYYIQSEIGKNILENSRSGTSQPYISLGALREFPVLVPKEVEENKAIVAVLTSLDDKIDLLHRQNKTLEAMAETLFRQWFIEEAQEDWIETKIKDFDVIVTDFVANGSFASLKDNVTLVTDTEDYALFIRNTDLKSDFSTKVFVTEHSYNFLSKTKLFGGEVIISSVGDVGSVFRCPKFNIPMTLGNNVIMLNSKFNLFLYLFFKSEHGQGLIYGITSGSVQEKFNKTEFRALTFNYPSIDYIRKFEAQVKPCFDKIDLNKSQIHTLEKLRDTLLPKLMSGEVRVAV